MKNYILFITILAFQTKAICQEISNEKITKVKAEEKSVGSESISIGIGAFNPNFGLIGGLFNTDTIYFDRKIAKGLSLEYNHFINEKIALTLSFGAYGDTINGKQYDDSARRYINVVEKRIYTPLSVQCQYHFKELFKTSLKPFIGLGFGGNYAVNKGSQKLTNNSLFINSNMGLHYAINQKLGFKITAQSDYHFFNNFRTTSADIRRYKMYNSFSYTFNGALTINF